MTDAIKMRAEVAAEFEVYLAEYEKQREARGWMPLEKHVVAHMHAAWQASRQAVVVELKRFDPLDLQGDLPATGFNHAVAECKTAIEAAGLRVEVKL